MRQKAWLRRRSKPIERRSKPVRNCACVAVVVCIVRSGIGQLTLIRAQPVLLALLSHGDQAKIMFGVLEIALCHHRIARSLRISGQLEIFFADVLSRTANLDVGSA